jgi:Zn-dependent protease with chaperone function
MDASRYQRFRLWSGICGIGLNLGLIWIAYLAATLLDVMPAFHSPFTLPLVALVVGSMLVLAFLPFEILIGYAGESCFSRCQQSFRQWLGDWSRCQWFILTGYVSGITFFGWVAPLDLFWQGFIVISAMGILAGFIYTLPLWMKLLSGEHRTHNATLETALNQELARYDVDALQLKIVNDGSEEGVNGVILPGEKNIFTINQPARDELEPPELAALAIRELWFHQKGQSQLCLAIVLLWVATGITLGLTIPAGLGGAANPLQLGLGGATIMTSWCFLALFVWPPLNNRIMLQADRQLAALIGADSTIALLKKIQSLNLSDTELPSAKEHVFHPIPSLQKRIQHLRAS